MHRLHNILKHEGCSMAKLEEMLGVDEQQIRSRVKSGCHSVTGQISRAFGKAMIQGYLLEPGRYVYDKNGELKPVYLK